MHRTPTGRVRITLASQVTLARIAGVPVFVALLIHYRSALAAGTPGDGYRWAALAVFLTVALTDALDGWLARRRNEVSDLGRLLDPVADKLLVVSSLVLLTRPGLSELQPQFPVWFTVLLISRDVFLVAGGAAVYATGRKLRVTPARSGKLATLLTLAAIAAVLARWEGRGFDALILAAALCTVDSWWRYARDGLAQLHEAVQQQP
jgi:CDP-diacylglycerol--glycerol-3-phosphate 3-phosphatidyltransferase